MKPLRVALFVKGTPAGFERELRGMGWWSYGVPQFTWQHFTLANGHNEARSKFHDFDVIFLEDLGGNAGHIQGKGGPPIVYLAIDSTLSEAHYLSRLEHAQRADLILADHDRLERFPGSRRLAYCVNDHVFKPRDKSLDVVYHCSAGETRGMPGGAKRNEIRRLLDSIAKQGSYSYRSGGVGLLEYAENMGRARLVVNWPRTNINRPHRVFDSMACRACLVTGILPAVSGDYLMPGLHYADFEDAGELPGLLSLLLPDAWAEIAESGYNLVRNCHTWALRAAELRQMLNKELGL